MHLIGTKKMCIISNPDIKVSGRPKEFDWCLRKTLFREGLDRRVFDEIWHFGDTYKLLSVSEMMARLIRRAFSLVCA